VTIAWCVLKLTCSPLSQKRKSEIGVVLVSNDVSDGHNGRRGMQTRRVAALFSFARTPRGVFALLLSRYYSYYL
jgi:hypothetical protein